mgnify:CR=1 FL=1
MNRNDLLKYFFALLFLTSTDTPLFGTNSNTIFLYIPRIIALLAIFILPYMKKSKLSFNKKLLTVGFISNLIVIISTVVNDGVFSSMITKILAIDLALVIVDNLRLKEFAGLFDDFMFFISKIAIITEIISYVFPSILSAFYIVNNAAGIPFSCFFIGSMDLTSLNSTLIRCNSIFWEPGAYAIYLIFAIINYLYICEEKNKKRLYTYIFCLIITFSTTGYIVLFMLLGVHFLLKKEKMSNAYSLIFFLLAFIILPASMLFSSPDNPLYSMVFGKIENRTSTTVTRIASFVNGIEIALDNPFLGISQGDMGSVMADYAYKSDLNLGRNPMNTNTVTALFAAYGFILGGIFLNGYYKFLKKFSSNYLTTVGLFSVILLAYCGENFYSFMPFIWMFYGYKKE